MPNCVGVNAHEEHKEYDEPKGPGIVLAQVLVVFYTSKEVEERSKTSSGDVSIAWLLR
jgi:hypothetical protein